MVMNMSGPGENSPSSTYLQMKTRRQRMVTLGVVSLVCAYFLSAYAVIALRVKMGIKSRSLLQSLQSDPKEFLRYMSLLPPIPYSSQQGTDDDFYSSTDDEHGDNKKKLNLTSDKDVTKDFVDIYGRWSLKVDEILENHCDLVHLQQVMNKQRDSVWCGPGSVNSMACLAGYYIDSFTGQISICPDGFFCPNNQVCYIICALGGSCNASKPVVKYMQVAHQAASISPSMMPLLRHVSTKKAQDEEFDGDEDVINDNEVTTYSGVVERATTNDIDEVGFPAESRRSLFNEPAAVVDTSLSLNEVDDLPNYIQDVSLLSGGAVMDTVEYYVCEFPYGVAKSKLMPSTSSGLPGCPGSEHLSLCPAGYYCPSPVEAYDCPIRHFCPLGSSLPLECSKMLNQCDAMNLRAPIDRPFFNIAVVVGIALLYLVVYIESRPFSTSLSSSNSMRPSSFINNCFGRFCNRSNTVSTGDARSDQEGVEEEEDVGAENRSKLGFTTRTKKPNKTRSFGKQKYTQLENVSGGGGGGVDIEAEELEGTDERASDEGNEGALGTKGGGPSGEVEGEGSDMLLFRSLPMADPTMNIAFDSLGLTLKSSGKQILKGVSGEFKSGRLAAIMGPSGTGKTTFLNTLSGRAPYGITKGKVYINQRAVEGTHAQSFASSTLLPFTDSALPSTTSTDKSRGTPTYGFIYEGDNLRDFTHLIGLVPQSDVMHPWLTVKETLWLYAKMRCRPFQPSVTSRQSHAIFNNSQDPVLIEKNETSSMEHQLEEASSSHESAQVNQANQTYPIRNSNDDYINDKVDNLMKVLGLFPYRHSIIGDNERVRGISGGQRKRVNVGMELVLDPSVLLLDEPTTGLDSTTSLELVHALRSIARHRLVTIAAVIHQPSAKIFKRFHDVLLLGNGGETVYQGPTSTALSYFNYIGFKSPSFENPADFFLDVITAKVPRNHENSEALDKEADNDDIDHNMDFLKTYFDPSLLSQEWALNGRKFLEGRHTSSDTQASSDTSGEGWRDRAAAMEMELPDWSSCFKLFLVRAVIEHMRFPMEFVYEVCLQCLTGFVIGALYTNFTFHDMQQMNFMMSLGVGFTLTLTAMRVFGPGMVVYWREAAPGVGMGLPKSAYFLAKCVVEIPRISLLSVALLATFYPMAAPRSPFHIYFIATFAAGWAVSGWAYVLSIAQDPKSAQLSVVVIIVIFSMFCGVAPRLTALSRMGPLAVLLSWVSFARWFIECLYVQETVRMSDAWRMPPPFYQSPGQESVLLGLESLSYIEGSYLLNVSILLLSGIATRAVSLICLSGTNRHQMGLPPLIQLSCASSSKQSWPSSSYSAKINRNSQQCTRSCGQNSGPNDLKPPFIDESTRLSQASDKESRIGEDSPTMSAVEKPVDYGGITPLEIEQMGKVSSENQTLGGDHFSEDGMRANRNGGAEDEELVDFDNYRMTAHDSGPGRLISNTLLAYFGMTDVDRRQHYQPL